MITKETEIVVLRTTIEQLLDELSRVAGREKRKGRLIAGIGALFLLTAGISFALGAGLGALVSLAAAGFCGLLSTAPFGERKLAAWGINNLEERLLREGITLNWTKGDVPKVTILPLHRPAGGPPPRTGEELA